MRSKHLIWGMATGTMISLILVTTMVLATQHINIIINGKPIDCGDTPPVLINGRTYVPARFVAEPLGATVEWKKATNSVVINGTGPTAAYVSTPANDLATTMYFYMKLRKISFDIIVLFRNRPIDNASLEKETNDLAQVANELQKWFPDDHLFTMKTDCSNLVSALTSVIEIEHQVVSGKLDRVSAMKRQYPYEQKINAGLQLIKKDYSNEESYIYKLEEL